MIPLVHLGSIPSKTVNEKQQWNMKNEEQKCWNDSNDSRESLSGVCNLWPVFFYFNVSSISMKFSEFCSHGMAWHGTRMKIIPNVSNSFIVDHENDYVQCVLCAASEPGIRKRKSEQSTNKECLRGLTSEKNGKRKN